VRKDKDKNYYAKSSVVEGIYKISSDAGDALDKGLDDFRNKKLFDFGFSDPTKIEFKRAPPYTKSGDKWMSGAKTMDNASVQSLIDKLRDLTATKFADKSAGDPVFEATVTSNDGKKVEKVTIRKQGTDYFAQREGEPSIYQLDAKAVDDLQAAAHRGKRSRSRAGEEEVSSPRDTERIFTAREGSLRRPSRALRRSKHRLKRQGSKSHRAADTLLLSYSASRPPADFALASASASPR
jgi:hypothetical protein